MAVTVTVLVPFYDLHAHRLRAVGDKFEATERRASEIDAALPGYVSYEVAEAHPAADSDKDGQKPTINGSGRKDEPTAAHADLSKMTVAQLRALAAERGTDIPKGSKKADIIALLEE